MKATLAFILIITLICCNGQENKNNISERNLQKNENKILKKDTIKVSSINFFDNQYKKNGFVLPDNLEGEIYPMYSYMDRNIGAFSVNYIGKTREEQDFWSVYNLNGFFKNRKIDEVSSDLIMNNLKSRIKNYYIIADYLDVKYIQNFDDSSGEFDIKDGALESIYVYNDKKWILLETIRKNNIPENRKEFFFYLLLKYFNNNEKTNSFSTTDYSKKETFQTEKNQKVKLHKESMTGVILLKSTYNQNNQLTIYNVDESKWKSFRFNDNFNDQIINPYTIKPENNLLVFKCLGKENGFYKIIVNDQKNTVKYIKGSDPNFKYQTIQDHILTVFSVEPNNNENHLKSKPTNDAEEYPWNKDSFYYPIKIEGNWLMVEDDDKKRYWIKWCNKNGDLILDLYYDA